MPEYKVRLPLECVAEIIVEAETPDDAISLAGDKVTTKHIVDWSVGSLGYASAEKIT